MKKITNVSIKMVCVLTLIVPAYAANFYVAGEGDDNNSGTISQPWRSIARVNDQVLSPGDVVYFQGGQAFGGSLYLAPEDSGTVSSPVVIASYGAGRATIESSSTGIFGYNVKGIEIRDLNVSGSAGNNPGVFFYCDLVDGTKLESITVKNVDAYGAPLSGIMIGANPSMGNAGFKDVLIENCRVYGNVNGIMTYGNPSVLGQNHQNIIVRNCEAFGNPGTGGNSGSGIVIAGVDSALVEHCLAYNNGYGNTGSGAGPVGIWCYDAANVVIQKNISHSNKTGPSNVDGGGFDIDGGSTNCVLQYNYSYNNYGPGYLLAQYAGASTFNNNTLRYNISQNDGRKGTGSTLKGGIHFWSSGASGGIQNTKVYGNTIYVTPSTTGDPAAIRFQSGGSTIKNTEIYNNLFITTSGQRIVSSTGTVPQNTKFAGNGYHSSGSTFSIGWGGTAYSSLSAWRTGTSQEVLGGAPTGFSGDPLLENAGNGAALTDPAQLSSLSAYKLTSSSPVINAGIDLPGAVNLNPGSSDFFGNTIPRGGIFDVGAHEADSAVLSSISTNGDVTIGEDYISYADQDLVGTTSLGAGWNSISLTGNNWKRIPLDYFVTSNTMLEFTINASDSGEVVGVGFENNDNLTDAKRIFQVGGSQNWTGGWPISPAYTAGSGSTTYIVPAGTYYSGQMNWLVFAADDDVNASTNVTYTNVRIYEAVAGPSSIVVEANNPPAAKSGDTHQLITDSSASGGNWALLDSNAIGDFVTYNVGSLTGGQTYTVTVRVKKNNNSAKIRVYAQASTGGTKYSTGDTNGYDLYSSSDEYADLATFTYTPGNTGTRYFRFEVIGKNSSSNGYAIGIDKITLTPQ